MERSIIFTGDAFLRTRDNTDHWKDIYNLLNDNLFCINLETGISGFCNKQKNILITIDKNKLTQLPQNIKFISYVNNHTNDGSDPNEARDILEKADRCVIGPQNPSRKSIRIFDYNVTFISAWLGLPRWRLSYNGKCADLINEWVKEASTSRCIVCLHWGYEHTFIPAPFQRELAHKLVDSGADLIIGHHPHAPQGTETYKGIDIFYSLGNFNFWHFDQAQNERNQLGYMVQYDIASGSSELIPYKINDNCLPTILETSEKVDFFQWFREISTTLMITDNTLWFKEAYCKWYNYELRVWLASIRKNKDLKSTLKFFAWLVLPLQLRYYLSKLKGNR